jgi:hypothetical protein
VFDLYLGIDYSGAQTPTSPLKGLQVYGVRAANPARLESEPEHWLGPRRTRGGAPIHWTRKELAERLLTEARSGRRFIAGIDHCFSFPSAYFSRHRLASWPAFLDDFVEHWPTHGDNVYVDFVRDGVLHARGEAPPPGLRSGRANELRLTERWTSSAKSVFQFDVQGSVAKSSHAGIPWLKWLRDQARDALHFWPFDGWTPAAGKSVIAEVYPSMFRNRYPRGERSVDQQDACATARWLSTMAARGALARCFDPPLSDDERRVAELEGWILGVC